MKKLLIVVDYQNDFVSGSLGFEKAKDLEDYIVELIQQYKNNNDEVIYTLDTHPENYSETYEGQHLPIAHCIKGSSGWEVYGKVKEALEGCQSFEKPTFPSLTLANYLVNKEYESILLVGLVSHICVISNAIMCKSALPNTPIIVDLKATSSYDEKTHQACIEVMKSLQIELINE